MIDDNSLIALIHEKRIGLTPEYDGGWHADIYIDVEYPLYSGYGNTIYQAVQDALNKEKEDERDKTL